MRDAVAHCRVAGLIALCLVATSAQAEAQAVADTVFVDGHVHTALAVRMLERYLDGSFATTP